jgi:hypothetical protein
MKEASFLERTSWPSWSDHIAHHDDQLGPDGLDTSLGAAFAHALSSAAPLAPLKLIPRPSGDFSPVRRFAEVRFMEKENARIWETERRTVLFVTNNIEEAICLGDRIISLKGKLPGRMHELSEVHLPRPRDNTDMEYLLLRQQISDASELVR